ncbi:MAG: hypothetical protein LBL15_03375 [Oscillospiraceae bacterium]|jgi:hypothetical protein|nr:hypothetical protein [Oscillospiraceae bacterium]
MKNDKIVNAFNTVQPNDEVKNRVFDQAMQKQHKKRPVFKAAGSFAAAAAVLCLMVLGSMLLTPQADNIFVIKAYAMAVQEDGSVQLREVDIANNRPEYWGGHIDGETKTLYLGIGLRCEGENIESVEFSTDDGFFAKQYVGNLSDISMSGVSASYAGPDHQLVVFGRDFDDVGSTITLDRETADNYLLFWGTNYAGNWEPASLFTFLKINVHAKASFSNGKTAERDVTIDLPGTGIVSSTLSKEQQAQNQKDYEAYEKLLRSIPLDKCAVVPDSVQALTYGDAYEYYSLDNQPLNSYIPITQEAMDAAPFDENGIFRQGSSLPSDGSDGYIPVIVRNGDDTFTGMVYKVPGQLILEYMK